MKSLLIFLIFILCLASINFRSNVLEKYGDFKDSELCVVVPTRNEAENLPILVERNSNHEDRPCPLGQEIGHDLYYPDATSN